MRSLDVLYESFQDSKYRCCPLLRKLVHGGISDAYRQRILCLR